MLLHRNILCFILLPGRTGIYPVQDVEEESRDDVRGHGESWWSSRTLLADHCSGQLDRLSSLYFTDWGGCTIGCTQS